MAKQWVIMFPDSFSDAQLKDFCDNPPGNSKCESEGHPDEGGLDFVEFTGTEGELKEVLKKHPSEKPRFVEPDMAVGLIPDIEEKDMSDALVEVGVGDVPWGLDRIDDATGLDGSYHFPAGSKEGAGAHVYVADTGVRTTHQDFEGRAIPYIDCAKSGPCTACNGNVNCAKDANGHGTHCAGTIGGKKYGVAKRVAIYGTKVLNPSGWTSWIMNSLDWVASKGNKPAIWSASLGGSGTSQGVGGNHGWRRIARSHALHASSQCCGSGSCTGWCTSGNNGQRSCSEKTGDPIVDFALAPKVLVLDETDQYRWQCCLSLLCRLLNCSCYSFSAAVCLHESVRGVIYDP